MRIVASLLLLALGAACDPANEPAAGGDAAKSEPASTEPVKPGAIAPPHAEAPPPADTGADAAQPPTTAVPPEADAPPAASETSGADGDTPAANTPPPKTPPPPPKTQTPPPKTDTAKADKPPVDLAVGKTAYLKKCKSCHGANGDGKTAMAKKVDISSLQNTKLSTTKVESAIRDGVAGTKMKPFAAKLTPDEITAVAAFVKTL